MPSIEEAVALFWEEYEEGKRSGIEYGLRIVALAVLEEAHPTDCTDTDCEETLTCREHHRIRAQIEILGKEG